MTKEHGKNSYPNRNRLLASCSLKPRPRVIRTVRQRDLIPVFGASSVVSNVLNGKRSISRVHARKLAEFFHVPASLFI
jgi:hypothetical protein